MFFPITRNPNTFSVLGTASSSFTSSSLHLLSLPSLLSLGLPLALSTTTSCEIRANTSIFLPRTQAEKLPAVMNQQREPELLVTERNCQEFGKGESPSQTAGKGTSRPFSSLAFSSFLPQNLLVQSSLEPEKLPAGGHKQEGARPHVPQGFRCSQGVKFNSGLTVASSQSCLLSPEPLSLFLARENNSLHRSQMLKEPT